MAKRYCKKSSLTSVANETRTRNGTSAQIAFNNLATTITNLAIPTDRGAPDYVLTGASPSQNLLKGKYTGGSVSVVPQNATAVLSRDGGNVTIESGKTLASVTVPAKEVYSYAKGLFTPSDKATSISISGITGFTPEGIIVFATNPSHSNYTLESRATFVIKCIGNSVDGCLTADSGYKGRITGASVSYGSTVTISNIVGTRNGSSVSPYFRGREHAYFIWGK